MTETTTTTQNTSGDFLVGESGGNANKYYVSPPAGTYQAVCVDLEDLGIVEPSKPEYKAQRMFQIVFQLDARITPDMIAAAKAEKGLPAELDEKDQKRIGQRLTIRSRRFTFTLGERSNLRPFLQAWRGKVFSKDELKNKFDVERLIGANAQIAVVENPSKDGTVVYSNIGSIMPWNKKFGELIEPENYTRKRDREAAAAAEKAKAATATAGGNAAPAVEAVDDDEPPF
jgi:hypothetical protein